MSNHTVMLNLLSLVFLPYLAAPIVLYRNGLYPLHAGWIPFDGDVRDSFPTIHFSDLEQLGFSFVGYLMKPRLRPEDRIYLAMFVHSQNKDSAELVCCGDGREFTTPPIFKSRFDDGFSFEVGNSRLAPHQISGGPEFPAFNFPQANSSTELYRIHQKLKEGLRGSRRAVVAEGKGELAEFAHKAEEVHHFSMSQPGYKMSATGDRYVQHFARSHPSGMAPAMASGTYTHC